MPSQPSQTLFDVKKAKADERDAGGTEDDFVVAGCAHAAPPIMAGHGELIGDDVAGVDSEDITDAAREFSRPSYSHNLSGTASSAPVPKTEQILGGGNT